MTRTSNRPWLGAGAIACASLALLGALLPEGDAGDGAPSGPVLHQPATLRPEQLQVGFEAVHGAGEDAFIARGIGGDLRVAADGVTFRPAGAMPGDAGAPIGLHVLGGDQVARPVALEPQPGRSHYFTGNDPSQWRRDVVRYRKVRFEQVYPGIDLVYYGNQRDLEYDFIVAPGADPAPIAIDFSGVDGMRLDARGNLVLSTAQGELLQRKPVVYQWVGGQRRLVEAAYRLRDGVVDFVLGDYDRALELVIDPVITYSTFIGGAWSENGRDVAVDGQGNFYVAGFTESDDFPVRSAPQPTGGGDGIDMFVAKYSPDGDLVYATYIASTGPDWFSGLAVDTAGSAYVIGFTDGADYPVVNAIQAGPIQAGGRAVVVTRIAPEGNHLEFSTYLGGYSADYGRAIAVDDAGNAYITGSASYYFPTTSGVINPDTDWGDDVFVAKIDTQAGALVYSTYIDGEDTGSSGRAIAVDGAGNAYVGGQVSGRNFPVVGGFTKQPTNYGADGFLAKLNPWGTALLYSTYYGGSDYEHITSVDVDGAGHAYVAGLTESDDLPVAGAFQGTLGGYRDAFVAKFDTIGGALVFASYLGGARDEGYDYADVAVDRAGSAYVAGSTFSSDFPVVDAIQPELGGSWSGYLVKLAPDGGSLLFGTYIGAGTYSQSEVTSVAVDGDGNAYVAGWTDGDDFPVVDAAQPTLANNHRDAIVMRIAVGLAEPDAGPRSDFDGDGRDDLVWRHSTTGGNVVWLGADGARQFPMTDVRNLDWEVAGLGDFDGDGVTDVFWRNTRTGGNVIWRGADYLSQLAVTGVTDVDWQVAGTGDVDGDGAADIVWRNVATGANAVWGGGQFANRRALPGVGNLAWSIVGVGDFDGDGRDDLLWRNSDTGANTIWPSANAAQPRTLVRITDTAWHVASVGDHDGDGVDDVFWRHGQTGANAIWPSADFALREPVTGVRNLDWRVEASGDYDGDGRDDLFWRHGGNGTNALWLSASYATQRPVMRVTDTRWQVVP